MKVYCRVCATLCDDFLMWLPSFEEIPSLIQQLCGIQVQTILKDREVKLSGSFEDIVTLEGLLCSYITKKINDSVQLVSASVNEENIEATIETTETREEGTSSSSKDVEDDLDDNWLDEDEECLTIEVLQQRQDEEKNKAFKFSCTLCSFRSQRESHFQKHLALHETSSIYKCDECSFKTLRFTHLRRHQVIHSSRTMKCTSCCYSTDDSKLLARHIRLKHKVCKESDDFQSVRQCPACPYNTTRLYLYERHMKVHVAEENRGGPNLFICSQCDYRTTRKIHYVRHIRDVHRKWRPYLCDYCGKAFKRPDALKQHSLLHAGRKESASSASGYQCRTCDKLCHSRAHLKEHQAVHSSERSFLCEICGASFKTRSVQRKHVANLHQNPQAFPCPLCSKRFSTNYGLRRHMKQHPTISTAEPEGEQNSDSELVTIVMPVDLQPAADETISLMVKLDGADENSFV